ncbi:MAG: hypothetical protein WCK49_02540 [Myxococcaceae bacterium]
MIRHILIGILFLTFSVSTFANIHQDQRRQEIEDSGNSVFLNGFYGILLGLVASKHQSKVYTLIVLTAGFEGLKYQHNGAVITLLCAEFGILGAWAGSNLAKILL